MIRSVPSLSIVTHAREHFEKNNFNMKNRCYTRYGVTEDLKCSPLAIKREHNPSFLYQGKIGYPLHPLHSLLPDRELAGFRIREILSPSHVYKEKVIFR
jgi:hypothetical protein